jgi:hypothetical protein
MWTEVQQHLKHTPARLQVAKSMLELGLRVGEDGRIYCGPIEIAPVKMARALGIDRRVVTDTVKDILSKPELREVFTRIRPAGPFLKDVAKKLGFGVIVITADPKTVGVVAGASTLIAKEGISIRQIVADDPDLYPEPKLTIITEREIPGKLIPLMLRMPGVKSVSVL